MNDGNMNLVMFAMDTVAMVTMMYTNIIVIISGNRNMFARRSVFRRAHSTNDGTYFGDGGWSRDSILLCSVYFCSSEPSL